MRYNYRIACGILTSVLTMQMNAFSISIIQLTEVIFLLALERVQGMVQYSNSQFWSLNDSGNSNQFIA
jgi:hypothetical protein